MRKYIFLFSICAIIAFSVKAQDKTVYNSYKEMVAAAKAEINQISTENFHKKYTEALSSGDAAFTLIDIRTQAENDEGSIPGAFFIQRGVLESRIEKDAVWEEFSREKPKKDELIILYCRSGSRSALAALTLKHLGYTNVYSLEGGWSAWNEKYPNLKKTE